MNAVSSKVVYDLAIKKAIDGIIAKNKERLFDKAIEKLNDTRKKASVDYGFAFKKYMEKAYEKYSKVKTILNKEDPKDLYSLFETGYLKKKEEKILCDDVNKILDISRFCIIEGLGGMGKSTLLKHFFLNELLKEDLIPIFIELKSYNDTDISLIECMYKSISNLGFNLQIDYFRYALEQGYFLILLDGYDEMNSNKISKFNNEFMELCDKYDNNYYIMTSRPQDNSFISLNRFSVFKTEPLTKEQAINLIYKIDYFPETKEKFIKALDRYLYDTHTSFASNPLLLNIMLLTFDDYAEIPSKLHVFYGNAFETLYSKHDATKGCYKRDLKTKLSSDTFKKIFSIFCFRTYFTNKMEFTKDEIKSILNGINTKLSTEEKFNVEHYIYDLENAVCLIFKDGLKYKFTHRSFQEYFVALYLSSQTDDKAKLCANKLIEKDLLRLSRDMTFYMLSDMNSMKFEKCIVLPALEKIAKTISIEDCSNEDEAKNLILNYLKLDLNIITFKGCSKCFLYPTINNEFDEKDSIYMLLLLIYQIYNGSIYFLENVPKNVQPEMREYRKHHHTIAFDDYIKSGSLMMKYIKNDTSFSKTIKYLYNFLPEMQERVKNDLEEFDDLF